MDGPAGASPLDQIRAWIVARHPEPAEIDLDADLIESRLLDSLSFVDFVLLLQELSAETIDMNALRVDDFRTLRSIARRFLGIP